MPSGTSFSDRPQAGQGAEKLPCPWWNTTLFLKNLSRFWPLWALYAVLWLLTVPLDALSTALEYPGLTAYSVADELTAFACLPGLPLAAFFSVFCAMAVFSYLYHPRSTAMLHALPIRREGLFLTNYLSGLSFLLLPLLLVFLVSLPISLAFPAVLPLKALAFCLGSQALYVLFFYSFAVFCAMFTGHILALPVFYGILNLLPAGLMLVLSQLFSAFIYGFSSLGWLSELAFYCTPVLSLYRTYNSIPPASLLLCVLYALLGLGFAALALVVYRRRALETAGDVVSVSWVKPIFKYGVAFCSAVTLGTVLYTLLRDSLPARVWPVLGLMLLGGLVGYFVSEMLLRKRFAVFSAGWKGACAFSLVLIAACWAMDADLIGFNRPPHADQVLDVSISGVYTYPDDSASHLGLFFTDEADIQAVLDIHSAIARDRRQLQETLSTGYLPVSDGDAFFDIKSLNLSYHLVGDSYVNRSYSVPISSADLSDPDSIASQLTALFNRTDFLQNAYFPESLEGTTLVEAWLDNVYSPASPEGPFVSVSASTEAEREAILAAVKADLAAGRLGRRFLFEDDERQQTCCASNLYLVFYRTSSSGIHWANQEVSISLQTTATETLNCLSRLGLIDQDHQLLTREEYLSRATDEAYVNARLLPAAESFSEPVP